MVKQPITKIYKLLSFLKANTDREHPATQASLRALAGDELSSEIFGDKGTFTRRLRDLAWALNTDDQGELLPNDQWKLVYPGFMKSAEGGARNGKIYYAQPISDFELEFLLRQVDASDDFTDRERASLKHRLMENLSSRYFTQGSHASNALIRQVPSRLSADLQEKLSVIRSHILNRQMLELSLLSPEDNEALSSSDALPSSGTSDVVPDSGTSDVVPVSGSSYAQWPDHIRVSPYRLVSHGGHLWLIANIHERPQADHPWGTYSDALTAIRVDLIDQLLTAHTPDKVYIHWAITRNLMPDQSYTRESTAKRITKARYPEAIQRNLARFDEGLADFQPEHMADIPSS